MIINYPGWMSSLRKTLGFKCDEMFLTGQQLIEWGTMCNVLPLIIIGKSLKT